MSEADTKVPPEKAVQSWYAVVTSRSLRSYLDHYRAMQDPTLEPAPAEGNQSCAKLSSSTFNKFTDHEEVFLEAQRIAEIMTGAMKVRQGPENLRARYVAAVYADGAIKEFRRPTRGRFGTRVTFSFTKEGQVEETLEKAITLFALRCDNPYVQEVLRTFAQSDDWSGLYRIMETVRGEINKHHGGRNGKKKMVKWGWVSEPDLTAFNRTVDSYRHRDKPTGTMHLDDAQNLVGRIVEAWLHEVAGRST
jgi:hypothetical protein